MEAGVPRIAGYEVRREAGRGGMGVVYLARHVHLDRDVALKVLTADLAEDSTFRERFIRESRIAASLTHPNIVPIYDAGEDDRRLYIAMRFIEGRDLRAHLKAEGPMDPERAIRVIGQLADALDRAHAAGLVHRDVKPANVLLAGDHGGEAEGCFLTDFGLSRHATSESLTGSGQIMGTLDYLAPEQIENRPLDRRADVYSLACVLYEILSGRSPFDAGSDAAVLWGHMSRPPPSIVAVVSNLPDALDRVLDRALAKDPSNRFDTCGDFAEAAIAALSTGSRSTASGGQEETAPVPRPGPTVCPKCGENNPDRARYCLNCSSALGEPAGPRKEERKVVSVLFVDLVGFSARSQTADPEDVRAALTPYIAQVKQEVERFGGTVERFMGDVVMAVFGAPVAHEDDAERAVRSVLRIIDSVEELNQTNSTLDFAVRAAINTGEAVVSLGPRPASGEGMVTGDVVAIASQLQSAAAAGTAIVGETTYRGTSSVIAYEELEPGFVEGKTQPLPRWRVLSARGRFGVDVDQRSSTPFIGREFELELLKGAFKRTLKESSIQLVTVTGEPGVGKSRMLAEFASFVDEHEELVFWRQGRSLPYGEGITFWALGEIVKAHTGILESDSPEDTAAKIALVIQTTIEDPSEFDWFESRLGLLVGSRATGGAPGTEKSESFAAWRRFLEAIAARGPLVLVFEDLHWADPAMVEFIEHLVDWVTDVPMLVLCTGRPELYDHHPGWGGGKRDSTTVSLPPLTQEETARLVSILLSQALLPSEVQSLLLERAGGNPLYAEEFVRMLGDRGLLERREHSIKLDVGSDIPLPETIQALIAARLDTLSPEQKTLLQDASVVGKVFWSGAVASTGELDEASVKSGLHELVRKEFVRPVRTSSVAGQSEYSFWHALIRDVAYGQVPRARRAKTHRTVAEWIEGISGSRGEDHAEVLAHHYMKALDLAQASGATEEVRRLEEPTRHFLMMAGDRAMNLDPAKGETYYLKALDLSVPGRPGRAEVFFKLADVYFATGLVEEAERNYEAAVAEFEFFDDRLSKGKTLVRLSFVAWDQGDSKRANNLLREAILLLEAEGSSAELCYAYASMVADRSVTGAPKEALDWSEKALELADDMNRGEDRVRTLLHRGASRCDLGDMEGVQEMEEALSLSREVNSSDLTALCYLNLAEVKHRIEGPVAALRLVEEGRNFAERRGQSRRASAARGMLSEPYFELGRWDDVQDLGDPGPALRVFVLNRQAIVLLYRGDLAGAVSLENVFIPEARENADLQILLPALTASALIRVALGQPGAAVGLVDEFAALSHGHPSYHTLYIIDAAMVLCGAGEVDRAEDLLTDEGAARAPRDRNSVLTAQALVAEARGRYNEALSFFEDASGRWSDFGSVFKHGLALWGAGRCLLALERGSEARSTLLEARLVFAKLDAQFLLKKLDQSLAEATALSS